MKCLICNQEIETKCCRYRMTDGGQAHPSCIDKLIRRIAEVHKGELNG